MTLKGLLLFLVGFLVLRAIHKAMRGSERALGGGGGATPERPSASTGPRPSGAARAAPPSRPPPAAGAPAPDRSPHEVLGVAPGASQDEIRAAYQRLARSYHPDRLDGLAPELVELANQRMVELNRAYEALKRDASA